MRNYIFSRILLSAAVVVLGCTSLIAQRDTLWIEYKGENELFVLHEVQPGETLYALSRYYGSSVGQLEKVNQVTPEDLRVGDTLRIGIDQSALLPVCRLKGMRPKSLQAVVAYRTKPGDNAYHISKRIFSQDQKCLFPDHTAEALGVGQVIVGGYFHSHNSWQKYEEENKQKATMDADQKSLEEAFWAQRNNRKAYHRNGAARVMEGEPTEGYLVLMDDLPLNTTIHLMNPMNNRECYAKVVGELPLKMKKENIIVVSELVMRKLNVRDDRFRVFVEYFR
jgi:murein DD-endopeptidase MepM/ murein hydrolase activator NlpD